MPKTVETEAETVHEEHEVTFVFKFFLIWDSFSLPNWTRTIFFQAAEGVGSLTEVKPEPMEEESAADAMAALSLSGTMNSGHSKKKKKKKRK